MSNSRFLSVALVTLLGTFSIHSATKSDPLNRLKAHIMKQVTKELDKKIIKRSTQASIATATLLIVAQLFKPKEKKKIPL